MSQSRQLGTLEIGRAFYLPNSSGEEYVRVDIPSLPPDSTIPVLKLANATVQFLHPSLLVNIKSGPSYLVITEVRITIPDVGVDDHFKAFASLTFNDSFVVRDLKVIKGTGGLFVSMPSRKIHDHCPSCGGKNDIEAIHCRVCGVAQPPNRAERDDQGRTKRHRDVAHPVNASTRLLIQNAVLEAYHAATNSPGRDAGAGTDGGH